MKKCKALELITSTLMVLCLSLSVQASPNNKSTPSSTSTSGPGFAQKNFNANWQYSEVGYIKPSKKASDWKPVSIPHTWNATDTVDQTPGYRRDVSWYKKTFTVADADRYFLYFEGVNMETRVYLNGKLVGSHMGGYVGFKVELTDAIKRTGENHLLVRVSNEFDPSLIPSQMSDFFIYGGITRDVWLLSRNKSRIKRFEVRTPKVAKGDYTTNLKVFLDSTVSTKGKLVASIKAANGEVVSRAEKPITLRKGDSHYSVNLKSFANAKLWSPAAPNLYSIDVKLKTGSNNALVDESKIHYGYRWFKLIPGKGFFVNGKRLLLRGTHRHEEFAGVGAAMTNQQHRNDMKLIKNMGANFVRLAHYPQDPEIYRAADRLGLILWDEIPWCRGGKGGAEWERNTESLLMEQLRQNFNHPSIAFWSLGNEIYWGADFPGGNSDDVLVPYLTKLNNMVKSYDHSRLTSIRKFYPGATIVDAFSPSIWAGWYGGAYGQYKQALQKSIKKYPNLIHMEYGGSSLPGRHTENPIDANGIRGAQASVEEAVNQTVVKSVAKSSDWNENYIVNLFDWHLHVSESLPGFVGNAQWIIRDFGTPLRPENPIPYINEKGLFDRSGHPKDAYYVYASYWSKKPMCYIESHTWNYRYGPKEGRKVKVFCNTDTAELYLNGQSLGKKQRDAKVFPAGGLVWQAPFKAGHNSLKVIGRKKGKKVATDTTALTYYVGKEGKFDHLKISQKPMKDDQVRVEVTAVDKDGRRIVSYADRVYFSALNDKNALEDNYGSPGHSSVIEAADGYASIVVRRSAVKDVVVEAKTQNVKSIFITIKRK